MRARLFPVLCLAALICAEAAPAPESAPRVISVSTRDGATAHQHITLPLNKAVIVQIDGDTRDVLVSDPSIVDAVVRTPRRIFLLGQKSGQTNAFFFDASGHQLLSLDIRVEKDTADVARIIREQLPDNDVRVTPINDNIVLSGHVATPEQSARAADIAARLAGDPTKIINMLEVTSSDQVMLKVRIAEVQRNIAKQLGFNWAGAGMIGNTPWGVSTDNKFSLVGQALADLSGAQVGQVCSAAGASLNPIAAFDGGGVCQIQNNVQGSLKALEEVGLVHILAEPNLTAVSGETAKFLAGGEFPVPSGRDQQGNISIVFKQFGVGLSFTPVVLAAGRISLQLSTEVSELTNTGAFTLQGGTASSLTIPALSVRRAETTVELPSGGSFAVAGLMQHTSKQVLDAFPGLKEMPVLGALFRSRDFQNNETELVVVVTAYLVHPTQEAKLTTPGAGYVPPTDLETLVLGRLNAVYHREKHPVTAEKGQIGYIVQ